MDTVSKDDVVAWLGCERYEDAMHSPPEFTTPPESAREEDKKGTFSPDDNFPWDVSDHIMSLGISSEAKMVLPLVIYRDVPTYGLLLAINMSWFEFDAPAHQHSGSSWLQNSRRNQAPLQGPLNIH